MNTQTHRNTPDFRIYNRLSNLRALSESSLFRYVLFSALYFAQGLPSGLMMVAFPAWLAERQLGTAEIGSFIAIVSIPTSFKFLMGPILDRYGFLHMGRRRPWVLVAQLGFFITFALISGVSDPVKNLDHVIFIGFIVTLFMTLQDVAVDGLAIDIIPIEERARANGFMWGSKTLGIAAGASGGGALLGMFGFGPAVLNVAILIGLITLFPLLLRERQGERFLPWTRGIASDVAVRLQLHTWKTLGRGLLRALWTPMNFKAIGAAFLFMLVLGLLQPLLPVLSVQELGWGHKEFSNLFALAGVIACVVGVFLSATIINRLGPINTLVLITFLFMILGVGAGSTIHLLMTRIAFVIFVICFHIIKFCGIVAILALFMNMCWKRVAATQFAIYMAFANLGASAGAALAGPLDTFFEYSHIFFLTAAASGLVLVLMRSVDLKAHQEYVSSLEE